MPCLNIDHVYDHELDHDHGTPSMLGIDYNSDSDGENDEQHQPVPGPSTPVLVAAKVQKGGLALPPPKAATNAHAKKPAVPKTKKIFVSLPKLDKSARDDEVEEERPAAKKPKLGGGGGGSSALFSMLPAPKKTGVSLPAPRRVLGGGGGAGLAFAGPDLSESANQKPTTNEDEVEAGPALPESSTSLIPTSLLRKGKGKAKPTSTSAAAVPVAPTIDLFGLSDGAPVHPNSKPSLSSRPLVSVSAAPKIEENRPPSPKIDDPYPGYYQLPSGAWAMHEPEYYKTYSDKWAKEYDTRIRAMEKSQRGFEGAEDNAEDVRASELADTARAAREEKKALTQRAGRETDKPVPKVALNPTKMGGVARSRHQLHSLLADAYMNREALEDKIAQGKRNRKDAGNKYGF